MPHLARPFPGSTRDVAIRGRPNFFLHYDYDLKTPSHKPCCYCIAKNKVHFNHCYNIIDQKILTDSHGISAMERSRFGGALVLSFDYSTEYIQYWAPIQRICKQETLLPIRSLSLAFSGLLLFFFSYFSCFG